MTYADWTNPALRSVKRALSSFEKASLHNTIFTGNAAIMPAMPGTEIEELLAVGFHPRFIHAVEADQKLADALLGHYWDQVSVYLEEISVWLQKSHSKFSYIHLDYCGHLKDQQIQGIIHALSHLTAQSRLRLSLLVSRKNPQQHEQELHIVRSVFGNLLDAAKAKYPHLADKSFQPAKEAILTAAEETNDPTYALAAIVFCKKSLGMDWTVYADKCAINGPYLPETIIPNIWNIHRYVYREEGGHQTMATVWFDFREPLGLQQDFNPELPYLLRFTNALEQKIIRYDDTYMQGNES